MVSYQVVALPALRKLAGHRSPLPRPIPAIAAEDFERRQDGKLHLLRVVAAMGPDGRIVVRSAGGQASHQLAAMAAANALALVPDGVGIVARQRGCDLAPQPSRVRRDGGARRWSPKP